MIDYGLADMEPKSERMSLSQWDGDPSGWRDYQQEVRLYKTGENLEVNWSVAARLVGGLRRAARRVCLAMTDQELLPTARNITDSLERKADRNRRGIEALMTRLEAELGQQRPQKKGESLEIFFVSNMLQRKRGERITDYITRFEEGIKTLEDNDINLLTIDDVPGRMLMRKASLTQERRERLIAALPDEHFAINDVKRVLVRLFPELHINEHRESDGYSRRSRNEHTGPSSAYQRREQTSYPRRYRSALATGHEWADTDSVDDETDVNSADLQGFVRSKLEALSAGIDDFPSDLSSVFTQDESSRLENAAMELSSVPEALVTIRAARDKMKGKSEGKGEPAVSFSGKGKGKWRKPNSVKHLQDKWLRESQNQRVTSVDNEVIGLVILNALEIETQISLLGQMINHFQIARTVEPSWWLNGLDFLVSILSIQICASIQSARVLSRIFDVLLTMRTSQSLLLSLARWMHNTLS